MRQESDGDYIRSLLVTSLIAPLGLYIAKKAKIFSTVTSSILFMLWIAFFALQSLASDSGLSAYVFIFSNLLIAIFIFGCMPPKYGRRNIKLTIVAQRFFALACLSGALLSHTPVVEYLYDKQAASYIVANKNILLKYSNINALLSAILTFSYIAFATFHYSITCKSK